MNDETQLDETLPGDEFPGAPAPEPTEEEKLRAQVADLKDKLLRGQADWDNSRKRLQRAQEESVRYASEALLEKLLPVLDNFEMGMQAAKTAGDAKTIESVDATGQPFDPHRHEALGHQDSDEHPEGHVIFQTRKGYKLKDRLLRPASVFVARRPENRD